MSTKTKSIEWTRISNDTNGNPRYVCHFFALLTESEKYADYAKDGESDIDAACNSLNRQYELAVKRANKIGGRKYHNKRFGGGIVFQSYNIQDTEQKIRSLLTTIQ